MNPKPVNWNGNDIPYDATLTDLLNAVSSTGPEAWVSIIALGYHQSDEAYVALIQLTTSPDWRYRRAAIEAIANHVRSSEARDRFTAALQDDSPFVVRTACEIVASHNIREARVCVLNLLRSPEPLTRQVATAAISHLWDKDDFDAVHSLALNDPSQDVRREASWTLRRNADKGIWRSLFNSWRADNLPRHRCWSCEIAGEFGDESVRKPLEALAKDTDGHVRKAAKHALERLEGRNITR